MNIKYFQDTDTALLEFSDAIIVETREISENLLIDLDESGNPVNITIEHAREIAHFPDLVFRHMNKNNGLVETR